MVNSIKKYNIFMRFMHWIMAVVIIYATYTGFVMTMEPNDYTMYPLHKSLGVTALALIIVRVLARLLSKSPKQPSEFSKKYSRFVLLGHIALYGLMIVIPLSGYLMSAMKGHPIPWFFDITLPEIIPENKSLGSTLHWLHINVFPYLLYAILGGHILMAFKHLLCDKVNIFKRII